MARFSCTECDWVGEGNMVLTAPHPFSENEGDTINGCPQCREANSLRRACDTPGCPRQASNGTPTPDGYVWSCHEHRPAVIARESGEGK